MVVFLNAPRNTYLREDFEFPDIHSVVLAEVFFGFNKNNYLKIWGSDNEEIKLSNIVSDVEYSGEELENNNYLCKMSLRDYPFLELKTSFYKREEQLFLRITEIYNKKIIGGEMFFKYETHYYELTEEFSNLISQYL